VTPNKLFFDDIGSYPLPSAMTRQEIALDEDLLAIVRDVMLQKISAGVEVPTYPQFRDMNRMFLDLIEDPEMCEAPYLIRKDAAEIFELREMDALGKEMDRRLALRVCVTGPVELYLATFGATEYSDLLYSIAESVARFLEASMKYKNFDVVIASIDEPSLGISPSILFEEDEILGALEVASCPCTDIECEVHLHSPLFAEACCKVPGINIIGVESAANPDYLRLIDRSLLEETGSFLRVGIARTDILSMAAKLSDKMGINLWTDPELLEREILGMESAEVMEQRLIQAYRLFGDRIRCAGPDCGLGSWPSQEMARKLLVNCGKAIASFRGMYL
jgi:5-methyltetrahydropteroyltriglutamate--homocysteine methyltransferase